MAFIIMLIIEAVIAIFVKNGFVRSTFGDFLVVILVYCFVKSFVNCKPKYAAVGVLIFAYIVEFLQLFNLLELFNLQKNYFAKTILGSTFQISDLIAYTLGIISILIVEYSISNRKHHSKPST